MVGLGAVEQEDVPPLDVVQEAQLDGGPVESPTHAVDEAQRRPAGPVVEEAVRVEASDNVAIAGQQVGADLTGGAGGVDPTVEGQDQHRPLEVGGVEELDEVVPAHGSRPAHSAARSARASTRSPKSCVNSGSASPITPAS